MKTFASQEQIHVEKKKSFTISEIGTELYNNLIPHSHSKTLNYIMGFYNTFKILPSGACLYSERSGG